MAAWWETFFDEDYIKLWAGTVTPERTAREAEAIWSLCNLAQGARVLDAPCGFGRISRALAERGAAVLGVDQSAVQIEVAERDRGDLPVRYRRHDLRQPLDETGFDVALNIFSSLGYGDDADDLAILTTLARAVRPGGLVVVDTNHRDNVVSRMARGHSHHARKPDGTIFIEEPKFDAVAGRVETTFYWSGPNGSGEKHMSVRVYVIPELVALVRAAGLTVRSVNAGLSPEPYVVNPPDMGGRVAIIAVRDR